MAKAGFPNKSIVEHEIFDENHPKNIYGEMAAKAIPARRQEYQRPLPPPLRDAPDGELFIPIDYQELLEKYQHLREK